MIDLWDVTWLFLSLLCGFFIYDAVKIREYAYSFAKQHCQKLGLQLLDQSVAFKSLSVKRDSKGIPRLLRHFKFEFSSTGQERYNAELIMLARRVQHIELEAYRLPSDDETSEPLN